MRMTTAQLESMRRIDISAIDKDALVDVSGMTFDNTLPKEQRAANMLAVMKNPYCFRHGDMVIKLEEWDREKEYDRLGLEEEYTEFLGNKVVCHSIPIRPGRNLAIIVETAAVNHRQKKMGYNAAQELYNRVQQNLVKRREN